MSKSLRSPVADFLVPEGFAGPVGLRALARVEGSPLQWRKQAGPFFGNELGELVLEGRDARFLLWATSRDDEGTEAFTQVLDTRLS